MTFRDIVINDGSGIFEVKLLLDAYFQKIESDYDSITLEEKNRKEADFIQNKYKFNTSFYVEKKLSLFQKFKSDIGTLFFAILTKDDRDKINSMFFNFWLIDENKNITHGILTEWQLSLFFKMTESNYKRILESWIKDWTDFSDNRETYKDIESAIKHDLELADLKSQIELEKIKFPVVIQQKGKIIEAIDIERAYLKSFIENQRILQSTKVLLKEPLNDIKDFIKEIESFEHKVVNCDKFGQIVEEHLRFPKYSQYDKIDSIPNYHEFIMSLAKKTYESFRIGLSEKQSVIDELKLIDKRLLSNEEKVYKLFADLGKQENLNDRLYINSIFSMFDIDHDNWGFDYSYLITSKTFNDLLDALLAKRQAVIWIIKKIEPNYQSVEVQQVPFERKEFDNSKLNEIINDDLIEQFLKHENRLKADGFITPNNVWTDGRGKNQTKSYKDLARLILLLIDKFYLKKKYGKTVLKPNDYKKFFEDRYSVKIKEQFLDAQKDPNSLEIAKNTFTYF